MMRQPAKTRRNGALLEFRGALIELVEARRGRPGLSNRHPLPGIDILRDCRQQADPLPGGGCAMALEILLPRHSGVGSTNWRPVKRARVRLSVLGCWSRWPGGRESSRFVQRRFGV